MKSKHRKWATGHDREARISDPATPFSPRWVEKRSGFQCSNLSCDASVDGAALFCPLHLWTFDNPILERAPLMFEVDA